MMKGFDGKLIKISVNQQMGILAEEALEVEE